MHHIAVAIPGGFAVAYQRPTGELCAVSDHATRATAEKEAQKLNAEYQAKLAVEIVRAAKELIRLGAFDERRPVRWFETDAFA